MRNDARPVGEEAGRQSPVPSHRRLREHRSPPPDGRGTHDPDRQSDVVNRRREENGRRQGADTDPAMPTGDSTLNIRI
jgi:hypothetical protein